MKCSICGKKISGHGHNPFPVTMAGNCCDRCNEKIVMPVRVFMATLKNKNKHSIIKDNPSLEVNTKINEKIPFTILIPLLSDILM